MPTNELTDPQLRAVCRHIARFYLEVERGLRPPDHLAAFLTEHEYQRHRRHPREIVRRGGPVLNEDFGRIHVERRGDAQVTATVPTRQDGERWSALVVGLLSTDEGWKVDQLARLHDLPGVRDARREKPPPDREDLSQRMDAVAKERRLVEAAHRATVAWLDELKSDREVAGRSRLLRRTRQQVGMWVERLEELDQELVALNRTAEIRRSLGAPDSPTTGEGWKGPEPDPVMNVLGPRPDDDRWAQIWDDTAEQLVSYRSRWGLTDTEDVLGEPTSKAHAYERDLMVNLLRGVVRSLEHARRDHGGPAQSRSVSSGAAANLRGASDIGDSFDLSW